MEGNQVGDRFMPSAAAGARLQAQPYPQTQPTQTPAQPHLQTQPTRPQAPTTQPTSDENHPISDAGLIWPRHLIEEIDRARRPKNVQLRIIRALFAFGALGSVAVSFVSLALVAIFQDFEWVRTAYAPLASRIVLGLFILLDLILIREVYKTLQNLRETTNNPFTNIQPFSAKVRHRTIVYALGLFLMNFTIWFTVVIAEIPFHILSIILGLLIILTPFLSLCIQKNVLPSRLTYKALCTFFLICIILPSLQILLNFIAFYEEPPEEVDYAAIERLAKAQAAARRSDVPAGLSDLVFAICGNQPYSVVYLSTTDPNSGLFECTDSHEVYSVTGPSEVSDSQITGQAFYFGTTSDPLISRYFPSSTGAKYIFRDFRSSAKVAKTTDPIPSELVLLLPGTDKTELVLNNLASIANLIREHGGAELRFSLFYTASTNAVLTTRDFILIAATDTITLNDWLPHGDTYSSIIGDMPGTYKFTIDHTLPALTDLGADPSLYSSQTRDAITSRRHLTTVFTGIPASDALRAQLLDGFVEP